jgi:TolA-binding protein
MQDDDGEADTATRLEQMERQMEQMQRDAEQLQHHEHGIGY